MKFYYLVSGLSTSLIEIEYFCPNDLSWLQALYSKALGILDAR